MVDRAPPFRHRPPTQRPSPLEYQQIDSFKQILGRKNAMQLMERDAELWHDTLLHGAGAPVGPVASAKNQVVERLFKLVRYAGLLCSPDGNVFTPWPYNIASCLSHGGRLLIQIPKVSPLVASGVDHSLWLWLHNNVPLMRRVGTHSVQRHGNTYQPLALDRVKYLTETHGTGHGLMQKLRRLVVSAPNVHAEGSYGLDIAFGGYGPDNNDDGTQGHLYFFYVPPTHAECGALLVGLEGEAPGKWGVMGNYHSWNIKQIDKLLSNKPNADMPLRSGPKWEKLGEMENMFGFAPAKYNGMFIDCTSVGFRRVDRQPFNEDMVFEHVAPLEVVMPDIVLPATQAVSANASARSLATIPRAHCQARIDKVDEFRVAAQRAGDRAAVSAAEDAMRALEMARDG
jgi:hypothetical protein